MLKEERLSFENIILVYYDSYSGINSKIGLLTCTGAVWEFDLEGLFVEEGGDKFRFGGIECDDIKECINKGFFHCIKKWKAEWIDYLELHLNCISNWNTNTNLNEAPCVGGEMIRDIFVQNEGQLFKLGTLSASYNKMYNSIDDSNVYGILNRFISDWDVFW